MEEIKVIVAGGRDFSDYALMLLEADALVAFWDGLSHGTEHMIEISRAKGIPVFVFHY